MKKIEAELKAEIEQLQNRLTEAEKQLRLLSAGEDEREIMELGHS